MGEALPFTEIKLALLKSLLGVLAIRYIDHGAYKLIEIAGSVEDRMTDNMNVPDPSFRMHDSVVKFEIRFFTDGFIEPLPEHRLIVGMNPLDEVFESWQWAGWIEP